MAERIKYLIKGQPTTIQKVASGILMTAVGLFIVGDFLYTPLKDLPLEWQIFAIGELIPRRFLSFNFGLILLFIGGMMLYSFRWRSGEIKLLEDQIVIDGQIAVELMMAKIEEVNIIDSEFLIGNKRLIQVITTEGVFKLKFGKDDTFRDFAEKIILSAGAYQDIKVKSTIHTRSSTD